METDSGGCAIFSRSAARRKLSVSARMTKLMDTFEVHESGRDHCRQLQPNVSPQAGLPFEVSCALGQEGCNGSPVIISLVGTGIERLRPSPAMCPDACASLRAGGAWSYARRSADWLQFAQLVRWLRRAVHRRVPRAQPSPSSRRGSGPIVSPVNDISDARAMPMMRGQEPRCRRLRG